MEAWRSRPLEVRRLGLVPYADALALQRALVEDRRAGRVDDLLLFVEHPHVLTLGVRGDGGRSHVLADAESRWRRAVWRYTRRAVVATSRITAPARSSATRSST